MSEKNQEKSPPPYDSTQGQQYGYPQGQGQDQTPQGYSHPSGYQPVSQGYAQPSYGQQGYPQAYPQGYPQQQYAGQSQYDKPPVQHGHVVVGQPAFQTMTVVQPPRPTNYLVPAILSCLCCFWPTGICAIVAACNANSAADSGDMTNAETKANTARNLVIITVVLGVICITVSIVLRLVVFTTHSRY